MISKFFLFIFFFRISYIYAEYLKFNERFSFYRYYKDYPSQLICDKDVSTFHVMKYPFFMITDFGWYNVIKRFRIYITDNCCGYKLIRPKLSISTLSSFDLENMDKVKKFYFCDPVIESLINSHVELKCYHTLIIIRYIIIQRVYDETKYDINKNELMAIGEINADGYKYVPYVNKFVGCYRKPKVEFNHTYLFNYNKFEDCASFCSIRKYYFVSFRENYCFCVKSVKEMGLKSHFKFCNVQCKSKSHYFCGGVNDQYFPLYFVCYPHNYSTECGDLSTKTVGAKCPPNSCDDLPGNCNDKGRNCKQNNGGCGKLKCVSETIHGFKYADCFADEGYNLDLNFQLSEIDECEYNIFDCNENETCVNTPGSYKCIQTQELERKSKIQSNKRIFLILGLLSLLILLILSFVVYKITTKNKKKEKKKPEPIKNIEKTLFRKSEAKSEKKEVKVKRTKTGRRIPVKKGYLA